MTTSQLLRWHCTKEGFIEPRPQLNGRTLPSCQYRLCVSHHSMMTIDSSQKCVGRLHWKRHAMSVSYAVARKSVSKVQDRQAQEGSPSAPPHEKASGMTCPSLCIYHAQPCRTESAQHRLQNRNLMTGNATTPINVDKRPDEPKRSIACVETEWVYIASRRQK